ncbi:hypothetical protein D3C85_976710 [compost metagenome]
MDKQLITAIQQLTAAINSNTQAIKDIEHRKQRERLLGRMLSSVDRALGEGTAAPGRE